ncbi:RNA polymerase sigma factor [Paracrocinitomix mangrovi]|uniref:RNA polymerase sigma factor n=1 Tax=Paracrocinitomix mangrovi TaxID=2862509 RepID=UPI001C8DD7B9|nr:RNA polymerase sigma factor [Paracrocinitomix mangrovi]UKN03689.1 RNA polymerase sigma factor [Paracrocinitomix mangrovi]
MEQVEIHIDSLIKQCLGNNTAAQFELYDRYSSAMYTIAVRMLGNNEDAQDALQDAFVNAFQNLRKFDGRVTFGAWLRKITINICLNKLRKSKLKWLELDFDIPDAEDKHIEIDPKKLHAAIEKLPSGCRTVFTLKAFEDYKHEEIAEALNISLSTAKSQYVRAKKLLSLSLKNMVQL